LTEFNGIKKFDFNPKAMKYFQKSSREHSLRPDGSNIAPFLKTRLSNVEGKERSYFDMRMTKLVPFYRGFEVRSVDFTPECMLFLREGFGPMEDTSEVISSAMNISDGTIVAMGLISALFLDDATTIILEEPERCLNPKNVKAFMEMCEEATTEKQVILTTHNPEAVRWTDIDNVRVVFRDENGFSHVRKPMELDSVRFLIENEVTLDNIFCNDAFGV
jgi:predicted ATPase